MLEQVVTLTLTLNLALVLTTEQVAATLGAHLVDETGSFTHLVLGSKGAPPCTNSSPKP